MSAQIRLEGPALDIVGGDLTVDGRRRKGAQQGQDAVALAQVEAGVEELDRLDLEPRALTADQLTRVVARMIGAQPYAERARSSLRIAKPAAPVDLDIEPIVTALDLRGDAARPDLGRRLELDGHLLGGEAGDDCLGLELIAEIMERQLLDAELELTVSPPGFVLVLFLVVVVVLIVIVVVVPAPPAIVVVVLVAPLVIIVIVLAALVIVVVILLAAPLVIVVVVLAAPVIVVVVVLAAALVIVVIIVAAAVAVPPPLLVVSSIEIVLGEGQRSRGREQTGEQADCGRHIFQGFHAVHDISTH